MELLRQIRKKCTENGVTFGVVIAPSRWQTEKGRWRRLLDFFELDPEEYDRRQPQQLLTEHCTDTDLPCLDLLAVLSEFSDKGEGLYHPVEQHWNVRGNFRVGQAISSWLKQKNLLMDR